MKQFDVLFNVASENNKKLIKILEEASRQEAETKQIAEDLADEIGMMLTDGNNLGLNFTSNQDDDASDKSLEIPGSIETDLAKDITDR